MPSFVKNLRKQYFIPVVILVFLVTATILVILYGKGYRLAFNQDLPKLSKTGLLVASSTPNSAQVYIDNHLTTTTDDKIDLPAGTYDIKIQKDGYFPWQKKLKIDEEIVTKAEARLFPLAPRLESIATTPVVNPLIDPSGTKIAYQIASEAAARKNGIYVLNMTANNIPVPVLTLQSSSMQIADDTIDYFSRAKLKWSPDGTEILAEIVNDTGGSTIYLLNADRFNDAPQDVTAVIQSVYDDWNQKIQEKNKNHRNAIKKEIRDLMDENFRVISWSPDETKILYQASVSAQLPLIIVPRRLGNNTLVEKRDIKKGDIYIYDVKEDTNIPLSMSMPGKCIEGNVPDTSVLSPDPINAGSGATNIDNRGILIPSTDECKLPMQWFSDSNHLVYLNDKKIVVMDDDGSNRITVYAGPFIDSFAIPWPDSSKIVILTNLNNPDVAPTLYTIGLK